MKSNLNCLTQHPFPFLLIAANFVQDDEKPSEKEDEKETEKVLS